MHDSNDLDTPGNLPVEDEVLADDCIPEFGRKVGTERAHLWGFRQLRASLLDLVDKRVSGTQVVLGDEKPDFDQVFFGVLGPDERGQ